MPLFAFKYKLSDFITAIKKLNGKSISGNRGEFFVDFRVVLCLKPERIKLGFRPLPPTQKLP